MYQLVPVIMQGFRKLSALVMLVFCCVPAGSLYSQTLIHYWNFNKLTAAYHNPNIPAIKADFSQIDTNKATVAYTLFPGTSSTYTGYIDNVAGDTMNSRLGATAGQALRFRNPSDSAELRLYIPTNNYSNISVKYELLSSSTTSGQKTQLFSYSTDSGVTWKGRANGLTVNGANVDTLDVTQSKYQGASWGLVTIGFGGDTTVNNNPRLLLRIRFAGNTSLTSGNNRFDNLTVEGGAVPRTITVTKPIITDTLYSGLRGTITYSSTGKVSRNKYIFLSLDSGLTWTSLGLDTAVAYSWLVPQVFNPVPNAMIAVVDSARVTGYSAPFLILPFKMPAAPVNLIHYWHFNSFTGSFQYPFTPTLSSDYTTPLQARGTIAYSLTPSTPSSYHAGAIEGVTGSSMNSQLLYPAGQALQMDNPSDSAALLLYIPTMDRKNIAVTFAASATNGYNGPFVLRYDYSLDSGIT